MALQQQEHEEKLRRVREKDRLDQEAAAKRRENEKQVLAAKKQQQEQRAVLEARQQKQREEEWERNMKAHQEEVRRRQEMQALLAANINAGPPRGGSPVVQKTPSQQQQEYDAQEAARLYREMRRETAANKMRAADMVQQQPPPQPSGARRPTSPYAQPLSPVQGGRPSAQQQQQQQQPPPRLGGAPMTAAALEEARRVAYWQVRHEAENNKRRILGLDPLPPQPMPPAAQQPSPQRFEQHAPPARVDSAPRRSPPAVPQPVVVQQQQHQHQPIIDIVARRSPPAVVQRGTPIHAPAQPAPFSPVAQPRAVVAESSDDEDEGYHQFLNIDAVANAGGTAAPSRQNDDFRSMENILSQLDAAKAAGGQPTNAADDDFDDPNCEDSDPSHFLLEGQTLVLPNCRSENPLMSRIESLRLFLEMSLGDDAFIAAYRIMDDETADDDDDPVGRVYAMLPKHLHKYVPLISQLIVCEGIFNKA
jgi:NIMA (never in mitosis gene a)-related kinase